MRRESTFFEPKREDDYRIRALKRALLNKHWQQRRGFTLEIMVYSYFMPVCSIVKTITPRCRGQPDALLHEAEGQVQ